MKINTVMHLKCVCMDMLCLKNICVKRLHTCENKRKNKLRKFRKMLGLNDECLDYLNFSVKLFFLH